MSDTTSDEIMVEPYEEVVGIPHYTSISRSSSPVVEEDRSLAETFKGPILKYAKPILVCSMAKYTYKT